jgi:RNA polymerase sigma-32 factor
LNDNRRPDRSTAKYVQAVNAKATLSPEDEVDLAQRWRNGNDEDALHQLTVAYLRIVIKSARQFRNYGLPIPDLIQEGNVGLMEAAKRFDPERNIRFGTYARWWIRSCMQTYILDNFSIVRTGTTAAQKKLFFSMRKLRSEIEKASPDMLRDDVHRILAERLEVPLDEVRSMDGRLADPDRSLNAPLAESSEDTWQDMLADERPDPEASTIDLLDGSQRHRWLSEALDELSPRDRQIFIERRLRDDAKTLEELGKDLGISKERVRQLEVRAYHIIQAAVRRKAQGLASPQAPAPARQVPATGRPGPRDRR